MPVSVDADSVAYPLLKYKRVFKRGLLLLSPLILLFAWGFWLEPSSLSVVVHRLDVPRWPKACDGFRVAVLADLHIGAPFNGLDKLRTIVAQTNASNPNMVVLPGDFVIQGVKGGTFQPPEVFADILGTLNATNGVFAVLGNHDWWLGGERVASALDSAGIVVLEDASTDIVDGECRFSLVGISDFREAPHDIEKAFGEVLPMEASLVFTHNPDVFPDIPSHATLTIAGHTHGGQVRIPFIGRPVVPSQYGERYAIGHIVESDRHLFVSSGIGTSILPVRMLVPPEISVLQIHGLSDVDVDN